MIINSKTIIVGTVAFIGVYLFFKNEAGKVVDGIKNTAKDVYEPVRSTSSKFGALIYDITHPFSYTAKVRWGVIKENKALPEQQSTINDVRR